MLNLFQHLVSVIPGLTRNLFLCCYNMHLTMGNIGYIYMMANVNNNVLYIGVTNDLARRVVEHAEGCGSIFTRKYNCHKLVYFEIFPDIEQAIAREKQLKNWKREWKNRLVESINPEWRDLAPEVSFHCPDCGSSPQ